MVAGAFFFSVMSALVKLVGSRLPTMEVVMARSVVMGVLSFVSLRSRSMPVTGNRRGLLLVRGLLGFTALASFYFALVRLPLAEATVIQYLNPVFTAIFAALFIGERMSLKQVGLVIVSFVGVVIVARPGGLIGLGDPLDAVGVAAALSGAFFSGGAYVAVRRLGRSEDAMTIVFWFAAISVVGSAPFVLAHPVMPTPREWLLLLGVGLTTHAGQVAFTRGLRLEAAGRAMAVGYVQIVFAAALGAVVFGDLPGPWTWIGSVIVVGATLLLTRTRVPSTPGS